MTIQYRATVQIIFLKIIETKFSKGSFHGFVGQCVGRFVGPLLIARRRQTTAIGLVEW